MPLLHRCTDFADSLQYLPRQRFISLGMLLAYYGFSADEQEKLAAQGGFRTDTEIPYEQLSSDAAARRIYEENRDIICQRSLEQDACLLRYLSQVGINGKCAVADVGWHGNMQRYLEQFVRMHGLDVRLEGFYIGIAPSAPLETPVNGFLYDCTHSEMRKRLLCFLGVTEKLLQSTEGSAAGYRLTEDGTAVPVLTAYEYAGDRQVQYAIRSWQHGALRYVQKHAGKLQTVSDRQLAEPLLRFGMHPTLRETALFSFFYNTDGSKVYFTAQKPLFRFRPKEFIHALANSPWKTGFMKSVFRLPLPYYTVYRLLRK